MKTLFGEPAGPQNQENAVEREKLPTVILAYRENSLFDQWIPQITGDLEALGRTIETIPFKRGQQAEIEAWMADENNVRSLEGKEVVTDRTVGQLLPKSIGAVKAGYLDRVLDLASAGTALGAEERGAVMRNENVDMELAGRAFVALIRRAVMQAPPKEVLLSADKLADHGPFHPGEDHFESERLAMEQIKGWLIESGVEAEKIVTAGPWKEDREGKRARRDFLRQGMEEMLEGKTDVWLLSDRHSEGSSLLKFMKNTRVVALHMPLGDLMKDLQSQGLLKEGGQDATVLREKIREMIEKDFKPAESDPKE